jgi:uncharacterized glyoxalase superfamily protein PhnB
MTIVHTSYVLAVPDLQQASRYWREVLGFERQAEPPGWDFLVRGPCRVMLGECSDDLPPSELGSHGYFAYIVVDDLDAYHAEIAARGAIVRAAPADKPWGMREMAVATPDGHRMMFAQALAAPT